MGGNGRLTSPGRLRPLLEKHGLRLRKRLGQNFLCDANILHKIVAAAQIEPGDSVLEIGAGIGTLTLALAEAGAHVVAVEVDERLVSVLRDNLADCKNVAIVHGDILETQPARLVGSLARPSKARRWKVVANIPYSITGPLLAHLLRQRPQPELMVLMLQKEAADRLLSPPGGKDYGSLSVLAQTTMQLERVAAVSRHCFFPAPQVESAIIRLRPLKKPLLPATLTATLEKVLRASFGQRRKTLLNALCGPPLNLSRPSAASALEHCGIPPGSRAESLSSAQFARLARAVRDLTGKGQK